MLPPCIFSWLALFSIHRQGSRHGNKGKMPLLFWRWQPFNMRDEWSEDEEQLIKHDPDINTPPSGSFIRQHLIGFPNNLKKSNMNRKHISCWSILWNWMVMKSKLNLSDSFISEIPCLRYRREVQVEFECHRILCYLFFPQYNIEWLIVFLTRDEMREVCAPGQPHRNWAWVWNWAQPAPAHPPPALRGNKVWGVCGV